MTRNAWKIMVGGGIVAVVGYFALSGPTARDTAYRVVALVAVASILVALRRCRPADRLGWGMMAVATALFAVGESDHAPDSMILHRTVTAPSSGDALCLAAYLFLLAGILGLTRTPSRTPREDYVDAAIISMGTLAVLWQFLIDSYVDFSASTTAEKAVVLAYPIMDVAIVFVMVRALVFGNWQRPFCRLLAASLAAIVIGTFGADLLVLHTDSVSRTPVDALFLVAYLLIAGAALHPSIADEVPVAPRPTPSVYRGEASGQGRVPVVAFIGFVPPTILLVASCLGARVSVVALSALSVTVFALVYLRMMWLIGQITGQNREIEMHAHALEASHRQRDALEFDLRHLAFHDELTGLANRALLHDRVEHALAAAPRTGRSVALCFGDLDGFKTVNDTLGHHVGDSVLVRASRLLSSIVRPGDTVARLGGDEFAVLMVDVERPEAAVEFAHRVVAVLRDAPDFEGTQVGLSISVGVAFGEPGKTTEQLLTEADSAMYEAKESGKNCVEVFRTSMRSRMLERLDMTNGFRWALGRSEFFLEYQPIISLSDDRIHGVEALVRWSHPSLGEVEPLRFIPIAEETGFIVPLGRWVLIEACEELARWDTGDAPLTLSVNLSRRQLISPHLTEEVRMALALSGVDPQRLMLEITETVLMENPERAAQALSELRSLGIRIAVDDFGTGYSSLSHLQRFPVDVLKIDKSFIDPLATNDRASAALVTAIIGLARSLGLDVIAEGIEHESQRQRLVELGCDHGQGFHMARPLGGQAAQTFVRRDTGVMATR